MRASTDKVLADMASVCNKDPGIVEDYMAPLLSPKKPRGKKDQFLMWPDVEDQVKALEQHILDQNVTAVAKAIEGNPSLAGSTNLRGISVLEQIVVSGNLEMVTRCVEAYKHEGTRVLELLDLATLYAIRENNLPMVQRLLEMNVASIKSKASAKESWETKQVKIFEDTQFSSVITPIVLASKLNRLEIVRYLIENNNCEIHPLTDCCRFCNCELCSKPRMVSFSQTVEDSMRRIEMYRALASPAFIFSTADDPVLEAFWISLAMRRLQTKDPAFKKEYEEINVSVRGFATELLNLCRSSLEIRTMLAEKKGIKEFNSSGEDTEHPRILLALYLDQKEFVAHPHCQQTMNQVWRTGLPAWVRNASGFSLENLFYILCWLILWPILCLGCTFRVCPQLIDFMKNPYNRFISCNIAFAHFLALLLANSIGGQASNSRKVRGELFSVIELLIIVCVVVLTARLLKLALRFLPMFKASYKGRRYWRWYDPAMLTKWRWYDTLMLLCFWLWIGLRTASIVDEKLLSNAQFPIPRYLWPSTDVTLIGEAFYDFGVLMSVNRLNNLVLFSPSLGPMQISLKKMIGDIVRFFVIFLIVMSAFVLAITNLYGSYEGSVTYAPDGTILEEQQNTFIGFEAFKNMFWILFMYPDVLTGGTIVVNSPRVNATFATQREDYVKHDFTEFFGLFLIGAYHWVALVILLNMLIAMMANSFNTIERNADMEWNFALIELRMRYIYDVGLLPPPFNMNLLGYLIQHLKKLSRRCRCACYMIRKLKKHFIGNACSKKCTFKPKEKGDMTMSYEELVERLRNRYWNQRQK